MDREPSQIELDPPIGTPGQIVRVRWRLGSDVTFGLTIDDEIRMTTSSGEILSRVSLDPEEHREMTASLVKMKQMQHQQRHMVGEMAMPTSGLLLLSSHDSFSSFSSGALASSTRLARRRSSSSYCASQGILNSPGLGTEFGSLQASAGSFKPYNNNRKSDATLLLDNNNNISSAAHAAGNNIIINDDNNNKNSNCWLNQGERWLRCPPFSGGFIVSIYRCSSEFQRALSVPYRVAQSAASFEAKAVIQLDPVGDVDLMLQLQQQQQQLKRNQPRQQQQQQQQGFGGGTVLETKNVVLPIRRPFQTITVRFRWSDVVGKSGLVLGVPLSEAKQCAALVICHAQSPDNSGFSTERTYLDANNFSHCVRVCRLFENSDVDEKATSAGGSNKRAAAYSVAYTSPFMSARQEQEELARVQHMGRLRQERSNGIVVDRVAHNSTQPQQQFPPSTPVSFVLSARHSVSEFGHGCDRAAGAATATATATATAGAGTSLRRLVTFSEGDGSQPNENSNNDNNITGSRVESGLEATATWAGKTPTVQSAASFTGAGAEHRQSLGSMSLWSDGLNNNSDGGTRSSAMFAGSSNSNAPTALQLFNGDEVERHFVGPDVPGKYVARLMVRAATNVFHTAAFSVVFEIFSSDADEAKELSGTEQQQQHTSSSSDLAIDTSMFAKMAAGGAGGAGGRDALVGSPASVEDYKRSFGLGLRAKSERQAAVGVAAAIGAENSSNNNNNNNKSRFGAPERRRSSDSCSNTSSSNNDNNNNNAKNNSNRLLTKRISSSFGGRVRTTIHGDDDDETCSVVSSVSTQTALADPSLFQRKTCLSLKASRYRVMAGQYIRVTFDIRAASYGNQIPPPRDVDRRHMPCSLDHIRFVPFGRSECDRYDGSVALCIPAFLHAGSVVVKVPTVSGSFDLALRRFADNETLVLAKQHVVTDWPDAELSVSDDNFGLAMNVSGDGVRRTNSSPMKGGGEGGAGGSRMTLVNNTRRSSYNNSSYHDTPITASSSAFPSSSTVGGATALRKALESPIVAAISAMTTTTTTTAAAVTLYYAASSILNFKAATAERMAAAGSASAPDHHHAAKAGGAASEAAALSGGEVTAAVAATADARQRQAVVRVQMRPGFMADPLDRLIVFDETAQAVAFALVDWSPLSPHQVVPLEERRRFSFAGSDDGDGEEGENDLTSEEAAARAKRRERHLSETFAMSRAVGSAAARSSLGGGIGSDNSFSTVAATTVLPVALMQRRNTTTGNVGGGTATSIRLLKQQQQQQQNDHSGASSCPSPLGWREGTATVGVPVSGRFNVRLLSARVGHVLPCKAKDLLSVSPSATYPLPFASMLCLKRVTARAADIGVSFVKLFDVPDVRPRALQERDALVLVKYGGDMHFGAPSAFDDPDAQSFLRYQVLYGSVSKFVVFDIRTLRPARYIIRFMVATPNPFVRICTSECTFDIIDKSASSSSSMEGQQEHEDGVASQGGEMSMARDCDLFTSQQFVERLSASELAHVRHLRRNVSDLATIARQEAAGVGNCSSSSSSKNIDNNNTQSLHSLLSSSGNLNDSDAPSEQELHTQQLRKQRQQKMMHTASKNKTQHPHLQLELVSANARSIEGHLLAPVSVTCGELFTVAVELFECAPRVTDLIVLCSEDMTKVFTQVSVQHCLDFGSASLQLHGSALLYAPATPCKCIAVYYSQRDRGVVLQSNLVKVKKGIHQQQQQQQQQSKPELNPVGASAAASASASPFLLPLEAGNFNRSIFGAGGPSSSSSSAQPAFSLATLASELRRVFDTLARREAPPPLPLLAQQQQQQQQQHGAGSNNMAPSAAAAAFAATFGGEYDMSSSSVGNLSFSSELPSSLVTMAPERPRPPRMRAVIVGVSYLKQRYDLDGPTNDVAAFYATLCAHFASNNKNGGDKSRGAGAFMSSGEQEETMFDPEQDTRVLHDLCEDPNLNPTATNLRIAIRWLVEGAKAGDHLIFYFSGSGALVPKFWQHDNKNFAPSAPSSSSAAAGAAQSGATSSTSSSAGSFSASSPAAAAAASKLSMDVEQTLLPCDFDYGRRSITYRELIRDLFGKVGATAPDACVTCIIDAGFESTAIDIVEQRRGVNLQDAVPELGYCLAQKARKDIFGVRTRCRCVPPPQPFPIVSIAQDLVSIEAPPIVDGDGAKAFRLNGLAPYFVPISGPAGTAYASSAVRKYISSSAAGAIVDCSNVNNNNNNAAPSSSDPQQQQQHPDDPPPIRMPKHSFFFEATRGGPEGCHAWDTFSSWAIGSMGVFTSTLLAVINTVAAERHGIGGLCGVSWFDVAERVGRQIRREKGGRSQLPVLWTAAQGFYEQEASPFLMNVFPLAVEAETDE